MSSPNMINIKLNKLLSWCQKDEFLGDKIMDIKKEVDLYFDCSKKQEKEKINDFYIKLSQWDVLENEQEVLMDIMRGYAEFFNPGDY